MPSISAGKSIADLTAYPLAWFAICFICGIFLSAKIEVNLLFLATLSSFLIVLAFVFKKQKLASLFLLFISLGAFSFQIEKRSVKQNRLKVLYDTGVLISGEPLEIIGISEGKPELSVGGFFLTVDAKTVVRKNTEQKVSGKIKLFAAAKTDQIAQDYEKLQIGYGTKINVACELRREEKFLNPGVSSAKEILDSQGIDATCTIKSPLLLENTGNVETFAPLAWIYEQRQDLILKFKKYFSVSTAGVLIASLLGNRYHLDKQTSESFRDGGTFHILVISGLQITFIGGLVILALRRFTRSRLWQFVLASSFLWAYTIAVGADAPVVRAALMFTILHFAFVVYRQATLLNSLGAAALAILIWQPSQLFSQSFQLTFMCVASIVAMAFPLLEKLRAIGEWHPTIETPAPPKASKSLKTFCEAIYWSESKWRTKLSLNIWQCVLFKTAYAEKLERWKLQKPLRYIFETLLVSAIVQFWLLPFSIVYFHRISLVSIFLNIWVGLLMAIESLTALIGVFIAQVSEILAAPFIWFTEVLNRLILSFTIFLTDSNWSSLRLPHYAEHGKILYFLYFIPFVVITIFLHKWKPLKLAKNEKLKVKSESVFEFLNRGSFLKISFVSLIILTGIIVFHPFSAPKPDGKLHIDFIDVGQGDSVLITMPDGETLLVDGGGRTNFNKLFVASEGEEPEFFEPDIQNIGETVVSRFLWEKGYDKVDYLLPSHADTDHMQGLIDVAKNFKIKSAIISRTPSKDEDYIEFQKALARNNISSTIISRGDDLTFSDVKVEILHPLADASTDAIWDNNNSTVLRLIYGDVKILLTGDIEKEAERELLDSPEFLQSAVVKVAHHGSKTSSIEGFVNATKAKVAIISVGRESPFGHPKPEIVERWKNSGAKVMTTGEKGTITLTTDGKRISIETYTK